MILKIKIFIVKVLFKAHKSYRRIFRPIGIGARTIIINKNNEILLIEHTYKSGLYFPGGGVKKFEELPDTSIREVFEEVGIKIENPILLNTYRGSAYKANDILFAYYVILDSNPNIIIDPVEIKSAGWYPIKKIPRHLMSRRCLLAFDDFRKVYAPADIEV